MSSIKDMLVKVSSLSWAHKQVVKDGKYIATEEVAEPITDCGITYRALGEYFLGKTIATSELYIAPGNQQSPEYWFLTFTDGTAIVVGLWSGSFIGGSHWRDYSLDGYIAAAPCFFTEDRIELIEQAKQKSYKEYIESERTYYLTRALDANKDYVRDGTKIKATIEFPDGTSITGEKELK